MTDHDANQAVYKAVNMLSKHFQCVQVLCSNPSPDAHYLTSSTFDGSGNWFARLGMCQEFLARNERDRLAREIAANLNPPEEDDWQPTIGDF